MPRVSGTWRDTVTYFNVPTPLHVADPRHAKEGHEEGPQEYAWQSPPYPYPQPQGRPDFGTEEVTDIRGQQIDITPDTHEVVRWGMDYSTVDEFDTPGAPDWDILEESGKTHSLDQGASRQQNYSTKVLQFWDERYRFYRIPGLGPEATDPIPALSGGGGRGLNGLSINNPPMESYLGKGFWPGTTEQAVVDRKLYTRVIQRHDERAQSLNLPYFEPNTPPPTPGNQSTSPFAGLQRMIGSVSKIALRRQTPPVPGDIAEERTQADMDSPTVEAGFYG